MLHQFENDPFLFRFCSVLSVSSVVLAGKITTFVPTIRTPHLQNGRLPEHFD